MRLEEGYELAQKNGTREREEIKANFPRYFRYFTYALAALLGFIALILLSFY